MKKKESAGQAWGWGRSIALLILAALSWAAAGCTVPATVEAPLPTLADLASVPTEISPSPTSPSVQPRHIPAVRPRETPPTPEPSESPRASSIEAERIPPEATTDPYAELGIEALSSRTYGGGVVQIEERLEWGDTFARYLISYPSDGLRIYGFLNVPHDGDLFPVALVLHGYISPDEYEVTAYTTRYADALAEAGFMVFHPNYRDYPPSDSGPNPFRIGYAMDVLNLIAIIKTQSQDQTGSLRRADGSSIHILGHSMGGSIALRVATVWPEAVQSVALYGSMSGDERLNYERIRLWDSGRSWQFELAAPSQAVSDISPQYALARLQAPVSIHHGLADTMVPPAWSEALCALLTDMGHPVSCYTYEGQPHTFHGEADTVLQERVIRFFQENAAR